MRLAASVILMLALLAADWGTSRAFAASGQFGNWTGTVTRASSDAATGTIRSVTTGAGGSSGGSVAQQSGCS